MPQTPLDFGGHSHSYSITILRIQSIGKTQKLMQENRRLTFDPNLLKNQHVGYHLKAHFKCYKNMFLLRQELVRSSRYITTEVIGCGRNSKKA